MLEGGYAIRAADMPGADDLMMRVYAAMAQRERERELISARTKAAWRPTGRRTGWRWRSRRRGRRKCCRHRRPLRL